MPGGAAIDADATQPIGERRTLAHVHIENAKLLATIGGKDALLKVVIQSKDETFQALNRSTKFIEEELVDRRKHSHDTKEIAVTVLATLQAMALKNTLPEATSERLNLSQGYNDRFGTR